MEKLTYNWGCGKNESAMTGRRKIWMSVGIAMGLFVGDPALAAPPEQAAICAGCHGEDGNNTVATFPKLAGQPKEYLAKQLNNYISGKRKNDMMTPIAGALKPEDIAVLAVYFSTQKPVFGSVQDNKLATEGQKIYKEGIVVSDVAACAGCHQANAEGTGLYPRLAGQHADYIFQQLKNFSSGDRNNDVSRFMRVVSKPMTEQEMRAVAEYLSGL